MIIQSKLIRAALVCAAKNDVRYYLNGLHITPKHIEATNGFVALRMTHGIRTKKNIIVQFEGGVPAKAETTELIFSKEPILFIATSFSASCPLPALNWWTVVFRIWNASFRKNLTSVHTR